MRLDKKRLVSGGPRPHRRRVPGKLFRPLRRIRFHRRSRRAARPISNNEIAWRDVLRDFWRDFIGAVDEIKDLRITQVHRRARRDAGAASVPAARRRQRSAAVPDLRQRPAVAQARQVRRLHRLLELSGMPLHPAARPPRPTAPSDIGTKKLGVDPETGLDVTRAQRPLRPLCAARRRAKEGEKPKRAGLPKGMAPDEIDLELALKLLSLPREVGRIPRTASRSRAGIGRFGPYVQHGKTYANLEAGDDVFTIGLNRAVTLIAEKIAKGPRAPLRRRSRPRARRPSRPRAAPIVAKNGRYGPYVSHDGVNATLPNDKTPETITLDEALALIDARAAQGGEGRVPGAARRPNRPAGRRRRRRPARPRPRTMARRMPRKPKARRCPLSPRRRNRQPPARPESRPPPPNQRTSRLPQQNRPQESRPLPAAPKPGSDAAPEAHGSHSLTICTLKFRLVKSTNR